MVTVVHCLILMGEKRALPELDEGPWLPVHPLDGKDPPGSLRGWQHPMEKGKDPVERKAGQRVAHRPYPRR